MQYLIAVALVAGIWLIFGKGPHPSRDVLKRFAREDSDEKEFWKIFLRVEHCSDCQKKVLDFQEHYS